MNYFSPTELWGGGKELILELCDGSLRLFDEDNGRVSLRLKGKYDVEGSRFWL